MSDLDGLWKTHSCKGILLHKEAGCLKKKEKKATKKQPRILHVQMCGMDDF